MRHFLLTTAAAAAIMLAGCIEIDASARGYAANERTTLNTDGDVTLMGADITASGRAGGEVSVTAADFTGNNLRAGALNVVGADIRFTGSVEGDVSLAAADIRWDAPVGGDVDIAASDLSFEGEVSGHFNAEFADADFSGAFTDMTLAGADMALTRTSDVSGSVDAAAAEFTHRGSIRGDLILSARTAKLDGRIGGQLDLQVDPGRAPYDREDGLVEISGEVAGGRICARTVVVTGQVTGPLAVTADAQPEIRGGSAADIQFTARNGARCERGWEG